MFAESLRNSNSCDRLQLLLKSNTFDCEKIEKTEEGKEKKCEEIYIK